MLRDCTPENANHLPGVHACTDEIGIPEIPLGRSPSSQRDLVQTDPSLTGWGAVLMGQPVEHGALLGPNFTSVFWSSKLFSWLDAIFFQNYRTSMS